MSLHDAMKDACAAVGIELPRKAIPGRWVRTDTLESNGKGDGSVIVNHDGETGVAWNHQTAQHKRFRVGQEPGKPAPRRERDLAAERRAEAERAEVERIAAAIVGGCQPAAHPYLARKGFPDEIGLVVDDPRAMMPDTPLGRRLAAAVPEAEGPMLIVPGRIGRTITTVQFITAEGGKKNILGGRMGGAAHRIATGRETWVCEGIATALSVRAALRLLGRSATVLSAFSASNVAKVASSIPCAIIAADNDKPVDAFDGLGTGEFYARKAGVPWVQPPALGDFNDMHQAEGLRSVALLLREVKPP